MWALIVSVGLLPCGCFLCGCAVHPFVMLRWWDPAPYLRIVPNMVSYEFGYITPRLRRVPKGVGNQRGKGKIVYCRSRMMEESTRLQNCGPIAAPNVTVMNVAISPLPTRCTEHGGQSMWQRNDYLLGIAKEGSNRRGYFTPTFSESPK